METKPKKPFYKVWWFWAIVVVVLIAIGSSAKPQTPTGTPQAQKEASTTTEPKKEVPAAPKEAVIKTTATELYDAYDANQIAADEKYKGKTLEITGTIYSIGKDVLNSPYVQLEAKNPLLGVQCYLSKDEASKAATLQKGQKVTLKGRGDGKILNAMVKDCVIVQ